MPYMVGLREAVKEKEGWAAARLESVDCDCGADWYVEFGEAGKHFCF